MTIMGFTLWMASAAASQPIGTEAALVAPVLLTQVPPNYPEGETLHAHVHLVLSVSVDGTVSAVEVLETPNTRFSAAARQAALAWKFKPALHDGAAIASRVSIVLAFDPPSPSSLPMARTDEPAPQPASAPIADGTWVGSNQFQTTVLGERDLRARASVSVSDYRIKVGALRDVPREDAAALLTLAPGIVLTNEGGEGHPERIFLRGFDAREGQDIELSVEGVPVNEAGNLHGNGYSDLNFIIPEVVKELRVVEGPFDLRQGNFAVAGSAEYRLGVSTEGLATKYTTGSFGTHRVLALWAPEGGDGASFGAAEFLTTNGYGKNREALRGSGMAQLTRQVDHGEFSLTATGYASRYKQPGVIRDDDFRSGKIGFYDTYDPAQGGEAMRFSLSARATFRREGFEHSHTAFASYRSMRLIENFTGFLLDPQEAEKNLHPQRGDRLDMDNTGFMVGARGYGSIKRQILGQKQELELGYFARGDFVDSSQRRIQASNDVPYKLETDISSRLADIGLYGELALRFTSWLSLRGGVRGELFFFNVFNRCAQRSVRRPSPSRLPGDADCLDQQDFGRYRDPTNRASTATGTLMPRATLSVGPFAGVSFVASVGRGVRSIDPIYIVQDIRTPFADIMAYEGGAIFANRLGPVDLSARAVGFATRVDRDLIFNETVGRNQLGGATLRGGGALQTRLAGTFFDINAHLTLVRSFFVDTGLLVPYAPDLVARLDAAFFYDLPWSLAGKPVTARAALGVTYVGRRPLPYGQRSDEIFVTDVSVSASWRWVDLGLSVSNLLDRRYRLAEFNYASDFRSDAFPTLLPVRHFVAGAPRTFLFTVGLRYGSLL